MTHHGCRWLLALALGTTAASASAQSKPGPAPAAPSAAPSVPEAAGDPARSLFEEGTANLNAGQFAQAAEKLRAAWKLKKSYDVAANLGASLLKLGAHAEAARFLSFGLREYPVGGKPSVKKWIGELLDEAKKEITTLRVQVSVDGADVTVNGESLGPSPLADETYVAPGTLHVRATKQGYEPASAEQRGEKGGSITLRLAPEPRGPTTMSAERPRWPAIAGGGLAVALVGTGIAFAVVASDKAGAADKKLEEIRATPNAGPCSVTAVTGACGELSELNRAHDQMRNVSVGLLIGAGVVAAATVAYTVWAVKGPVRAGMTVGPRGTGILVQGAF